MQIRLSASTRFVLALLRLSSGGGFFKIPYGGYSARLAKASDEEVFAHLLWRKKLFDRGSETVKWYPKDEERLKSLSDSLKSKGVDPLEITPKRLRREEDPALGSPAGSGRESGFGQAVIDIISKQFPEMLSEIKTDERYGGNPAAKIGNILKTIALKQVQFKEEDAFDAIQDLLTYLVSSKFNFKAESKKGRPGASTWKAALNNVYSNLRARAMSHSMRKNRKEKAPEEDIYAHLLWRKEQSKSGKTSWANKDDIILKRLENSLREKKVDVDLIKPKRLSKKDIYDKSLDQAFGKADEGGLPEGGIQNVPQSDEGMGKPLDDMAAKKSFLNALDELVPDFVTDISDFPAQRLLFDFIFSEHGSGSFLPNIELNMNQSSDFKEYLLKIVAGGGPDSAIASDLLEKYKTRWSGFVGDTRKKLLESIREFTEAYLSEEEYNELWDEFFSDTTVKGVEKRQLKDEADKLEEQRVKDLKKILRMQSLDQQGVLSDQQKSELTKLRKRVTKEVFDEYQSRLVNYNKKMDAYLKSRADFSDLPPEKQPGFKRPEKPLKPVSLDQQLEAVWSKYKNEIMKDVNEEVGIYNKLVEKGQDIKGRPSKKDKKFLKDEEKKNKGKEPKEIEEIIDEDEGTGRTSSSYDLFFKRFLPDMNNGFNFRRFFQEWS